MFGSSVNAVEIDYTITSSFRHSDNLAERPEALGGDATSAALTLDIESVNNAAWDFRLSSNFASTDYSVSELEREDRKSFALDARYDPANSNFDLLLSNNYSQVPRNRFVSQSVNNLREISVSYIRPIYFIKLSPLDRLNVDYTYIDFTNLNASEDSSILYGTRISQESSLGYEKKISAISSIGVYQSKVDTSFSEAINDSIIDFEQTDTFIRWQTTGQFTQLAIEYGFSDVINVRKEKVSSTLKRLSFNRRINSNQVLTLRYQVGFDTVLNSNLATNSININSASSDFGTAQEVDEASVEYTYAGALLSTSLSYIDRKTSSAIGDDSEEREEFVLSVEYSLSRLFNVRTQNTIEVFARVFDNEFDTELSSITESSTQIYGLRYNHPINRNLVFFSEYAKRNSEDDNTDQNTNVRSYSIEFGIVYNP